MLKPYHTEQRAYDTKKIKTDSLLYNLTPELTSLKKCVGRQGVQ